MWKAVKDRRILLLFFLFSPIQSFSQNETILINFKASSTTIGSVIEAVHEQTKSSFIYKASDVDPERNVHLSSSAISLNDLLKEAFPKNEFNIKLRRNSIILKKQKSAASEAVLKNDFSVKGYVADAKTGEALIGATVIIANTYKGTASNKYGFYSIALSGNEHELIVSSIGYETKKIVVSEMTNQTVDIQLKPESVSLQEVVVTADDYVESLSSVNMNTKRMSAIEIKQTPTLAGEADLIKAVQLLPGVSTQAEGATNFNVRGGSVGQNLILLDEATVYNPSHLMGFFSVFNPDAINGLTFYRNDFPANYGNRLSSVLDIQMKEGNTEKHSVSGGIGTVSSRLLFEGPLVKDKSSFLLSGRRTYADLFFKLSADEYTKQSSLFFYDFNLKTNYKINDNNKIFVSAYFGRDAIKIRSLQYHIFWGNATGTLRWNHIFNNRLFSNTSLIYSNYNYEIDFPRANTPVNWLAGITDVKGKIDFTWYANPANTIKFGIESSFKKINPGKPKYSDSVFENVPQAKTNLTNWYLLNEQSVNDRLKISYGVRFNLYSLLGPYEELSFSGNHVSLKEHEAGIIDTKSGIEPRLGLSYKTGVNSALKLNYNRTMQYLQLLSNSVSSFSVLDVWYPANRKIDPASSTNYSLGWFLKFAKNKYRFSSEIYYRKLKKQLDFEDHSLLIMNRNVEKLMRSGKGEAYGLELSLEKKLGKLKGTVSYAFSRVFYEIPEINDGKKYPAAHDQPHNIAIHGNYPLSERWTVSANWVYSSGYATTLPKETFVFDDYIVPVYGEKNRGRIPDYHRLDLSFTLKNKRKPGRKNQGSWVFSLYNAYGRLNALTVFVGPVMKDINIIEDKNRIAYQKLSLFSVIPGVTYNFKF